MGDEEDLFVFGGAVVLSGQIANELVGLRWFDGSLELERGLFAGLRVRDHLAAGFAPEVEGGRVVESRHAKGVEAGEALVGGVDHENPAGGAAFAKDFDELADLPQLGEDADAVALQARASRIAKGLRVGQVLIIAGVSVDGVLRGIERVLAYGLKDGDLSLDGCRWRSCVVENQLCGDAVASC